MHLIKSDNGEIFEILRYDEYNTNVLLTKDIVRDKHFAYYNIPVAFDIETTIIDAEIAEENNPQAIMYIWQICIVDTIIIGRYWDDCIKFFDLLSNACAINNCKLAIYIHNLSYEFEFLSSFLDFKNIFAVDAHKPIRATYKNLEFRCSYKLTNMSLSRWLVSAGVKHCKRTGSIDYKIKRYPWTHLDDNVLLYSIFDVLGLCEGIQQRLDHGETIASLPYTSTGYVRRKANSALSDYKYYKSFYESRLSEDQYIMCKQAARGGLVDANARFGFDIIEGVKSVDRKSSYLAVFMCNKFPMSKFFTMTESAIGSFACLIDITYSHIRIKSPYIIPYIGFSRCYSVSCDAIIDNGKIVEACEISTVITDIDFFIILKYYNFDYKINKIYGAEYDYLPKPFRQIIHDDFYFKETSRSKGEYYYMRAKNDFNSYFGMCLTDIVRESNIFDSQSGWKAERGEVLPSLIKHYNNKNNRLWYQHGVWTTAHARNELCYALDITGADTVYCDTDSDKYINDYDFSALNDRIIKQCESVDVPAYIDIDGKPIYLGVWEEDGVYDKFISLGAKKYAYETNGRFSITVSGLNKESGLEYIGNIGNFTPGFNVPKEYSGRTTAYYNYIDKVITVEGHKLRITNNVAIIETDYTLTVSSNYRDYIANIDEYAAQFDSYLDNVL